MTDKTRLNVVMFSGGRGTASITEAFLNHGQISLTLLVNTYDDGLSTGALRTLVPGMLGPSDVRKNISRLMPSSDRADRALRYFLEYRFAEKIDKRTAIHALQDLCGNDQSFPVPDFAKPYLDLNLSQTRAIAGFLRSFLTYFEKEAPRADAFEFGDCSFGNILFTGCYLNHGQSFNKAVEAFSAFARIRGRVLNLTTGDNLVLVALKRNGAVLVNESGIVAEQDSEPIQDIFLLSGYLSSDQLKTLEGKDVAAKADFLSSLERTPSLCPEAEAALRKADIIIYGPGTQHSSLFPSYLTHQVAESIAANQQAEKIFVGNIAKDFEIRNESATTLVQKFLYYLNRKGKKVHDWKDLVTLFFMQSAMPSSQRAADYVFFDPATFPFPRERVVLTNWERTSGSHSGGMVTDELISVVNSKWSKKMRPYHHMVSILVPALDEERTVKTVLQDLSRLNFESLGLAREILLIDGGSKDRTVALARSVPDVAVYELPRGSGRGTVLRHGIEQANGNIIVFFPSDKEYDPEDLMPIVQTVATADFQVVYGSRTIKCVDMSERILSIYKGNYFLYLSSKYGGMLISILGLLLFNRFISDPLTGIKAFEARLLKSLNLKARGFDVETEILSTLGKKRIFIFEQPVDYHPRSRAEGKKTTFWDGIGAVLRMLRVKWSR